MIATDVQPTLYPRFPFGRFLLVIGAIGAIFILMTKIATAPTAGPRFNPQAGEITRAQNGATITLTWHSTGDGYCQIGGTITLADGQNESFGQRVVTPCRGQDVRGAWEKFVSKIFERFSMRPDLLKDQIIPVIDKIWSVLHGLGT